MICSKNDTKLSKLRLSLALAGCACLGFSPSKSGVIACWNRTAIELALESDFQDLN